MQSVIQVFEHQSIKIGETLNDSRQKHKVVFSEKHHSALEKYYGSYGVPYYSLIHKGIKFNEYVGVIHVDNITIEVLPKIDSLGYNTDWHRLLVDMLKYVGLLKTDATSYADLKLKSNSILDLYLELFLHECEWLLHKGLIKKYRRKESNQQSLRGRINFQKQIEQNLIHQERFYIRHTVYDREHELNRIIYKTLLLIKKINPTPLLYSKVCNILIDYPVVTDILVNDSLFKRIEYNRKTIQYKTAIEIARLILLNYHPDIITGKDDLIAIMFDMNMLWEAFVLKSLKRNSQYRVKGQVEIDFWKSEGGAKATKIRPDIVLEDGSGVIVLDTKWKIPIDGKPSISDLHQMYSYSQFFEAYKSYLVYPSEETKIKKGDFKKAQNESAGLGFVSIIKDGKLNIDAGKDFFAELNR